MSEFLSSPWTIAVGGGLLVGLILLAINLKLSRKLETNIGQGGRGGHAKASGQNSSAVGGNGGRGGPYGKGGDGGNAKVIGDDSFAMGGEGGEAGQFDRGGNGGRSPFEIMGRGDEQLPDGTFLRDYGRGGDGANPVNNPAPNEKDKT